MADISVKTKIDTKINTKTRLETLYYFVYEMAESFGVDSDGLDTITKGILNRRILSEIMINYKDNNDVTVGKVTISIDWDKHTFFTSTDYGATFTLDSSKSVRSQVSEISDTIVEHVNNMRKSLKIKRIMTRYRYTSEIKNDDEKYREAQKYLGHETAEKDNISLQKDFTSSLEWLCDKLKEVKITVENS